MAKVTKTRRARKVKDVANVNAAPEVKQISFHAAIEQDACNSVEILEIDASEETNEQDIRALYRHALAINLRERVDYELSKQAQSCADKYVNYAKDILNERVSNVFFDARVVPDFCNKSERAGYRFNEKTTMRMRDIARFLCKVASLTNYTDAIFRSALAFDNAGIEFSSHHAFACCSANDKRFTNVEHLMTHVSQIYGETTQQAQHSMSLNALIEMHALTESRTGKTSTYKVNRESFLAQALALEMNLSI